MGSGWEGVCRLRCSESDSGWWVLNPPTSYHIAVTIITSQPGAKPCVKYSARLNLLILGRWEWGVGAWGLGGLLVSPNQLASCGNLVQRAAANMKPALTLDKKKKKNQSLVQTFKRNMSVN